MPRNRNAAPICNVVHDHVLALAGQNDPRSIAEGLLNSLRQFGFDNAALGEFADGTAHRSLFFVSLWPERIMRQYFEEGFSEHDYLVPRAMKSAAPFTWEEVYLLIRDRPGVEDLHDFVSQNFWEDGLAIPVHQPDGRRGLVSLAADRLEMAPEHLPAIQAMAILSYLKIREISLRRDKVPPLTGREGEVMHWVAAGKTDSEIADILTISQATAHFHVENAKRKLNCISRTQAAAKAVHLGLVQP